jgi:hypothetical protein
MEKLLITNLHSHLETGRSSCTRKVTNKVLGQERGHNKEMGKNYVHAKSMYHREAFLSQRDKGMWRINPASKI